MYLRNLAAFATLVLSGCSFLGATGDNQEPAAGALLSIEGTLVDFQRGTPLAVSFTLATSGLVPERNPVPDGATFRLDDVPEHSALQLRVTAPTYHATVGPSIVLESEALTGVVVPVVSEAYFTALSAAFGVVPDGERGVLLAQVVDDAGAPRADVTANAFQLAAGEQLDGPYFLDAELLPDATATATSASGWVVYFELAPGVAALTQAPTATVTLEMADAPVLAGAVTVAQIQLSDGPPLLFSDVSLDEDVKPIFTARGCVGCHRKGKGNESGGLALSESGKKLHDELTKEDPTRVITSMPEMSLLLTMPSREDPPDRHPNVTFASATDPDFQKIYVWIKEGAKNN